MMLMVQIRPGSGQGAITGASQLPVVGSSAGADQARHQESESAALLLVVSWQTPLVLVFGASLYSAALSQRTPPSANAMNAS